MPRFLWTITTIILASIIILEHPPILLKKSFGWLFLKMKIGWDAATILLLIGPQATFQGFVLDSALWEGLTWNLHRKWLSFPRSPIFQPETVPESEPPYFSKAAHCDANGVPIRKPLRKNRCSFSWPAAAASAAHVHSPVRKKQSGSVSLPYFVLTAKNVTAAWNV